MIKRFEELKKQLTELAGVLNTFKSEAVQLKLVEFVFKTEEEAEPPEETSAASPPKEATRGSSRRARKAKSPKEANESKSQRKRGGTQGPAQLLTSLISDGFFKSKQPIGQIIAHAKSKKATSFKPNELSGTLARFVRDERLHRETNKDGQYEYYAK